MKRPCLLLLLITLASCRPVGPDYRGAPGVAHDQRFKNATTSQAAPTLDSWWRRLGDANLNRLVSSVLKDNLDLKISGERLREARALRRQSGAVLLPHGHGNLSFTRRDIGRGGGGLTGEIAQSGFFPDPLEYWSSGLDVSWEIDVFGGSRRATQAAEARVGSARAQLHATRHALVRDTPEAYCTLVGLKEQFAQVLAQTRSQEEQLSNLIEREAAGAASKLEVDRSRTRLESTRALAPTLTSGIEIQQRRLLTLLGTARHRSVTSARTLPANLPMVRAGLPAELLTRRPDIRQAERELAAATAEIGVATANFYPRLSLLGGPSSSTRTLGNLFDAVNYDWQLGPSVSWSLFSGGKNRAILNSANARQRQAFHRYEKAFVQAIHEVESELASLRAETQRLAAIQRLRMATAQSVKRVRQTRDAGAADPIEVLVEEDRLREAELAEIRVKTQLILVWTRFHKALGGGWQ